MLSTPDLLFAGAVASILRPPVMIEIGTASGFSAAVLAKTISLRLEELGCPASGPVVHTFDKKVQYTEEQNQPIGFAVDLISRGTRDLVAVHASQDSSHCAQFVEQGDLTFAFIDGNHQHPWPLLDVLRIQRLMHTGWILLHDIDLPGVITRARAAGQQIDQPSGAGAKHVFDSWPSGKSALETLVLSGFAKIGAGCGNGSRNCVRCRRRSRQATHRNGGARFMRCSQSARWTLFIRPFFFGSPTANTALTAQLALA